MTENEMNEQVCFYPAKDIEAVFKKAEGAEGEAGELERLREFYRNMLFFYDFAVIQDCDAGASGENLITIYEYAKQGAGIKL